MKIFIYLFAACILFFTMPSCKTTAKHDNGKHKGWYKNPKNPHHPAHGTASKSNNSKPAQAKKKGKK